MLEKLTVTQLAEWEAYLRIDPAIDDKIDFHFASLSSLITNLAIQLYGKKGTPPAQLKEFIVDWDFTKEVETPTQSVEDMKKVLMGIATAQNKKVNNQKLSRK